MLIGTLNDEVASVISEGERRLDCLLEVPGSAPPVFDPVIEEVLQRKDSESDCDVLKVSPLNIRLSEMKRGLIGILIDSLWLFCFVSW